MINTNKEDKNAVIGLSGESIFMKVDHFNEEGETVVATSYNKEYGGKGYNQALAAARFGKKVSFLTVFGDDEISKCALKSLEKEKINCKAVIKKGLKSAAASIIIDKEGKNRVICYQGASDYLNKEDVRSFEEEIATSKYLLLQLETSKESLEEAINIASKYDTKIILNPAPAYKLDNKLLDKCYIITPNEQEVKILYGLNEEINEKSILKLPQKRIIVTLGDKGSILKDDEIVHRIKPLVVKAINTTGAGDTYNGVLTAALLEGRKLEEAAILASIASSISVSREFVIDSIPYHNEIMEEFDKTDICRFFTN